MKTAIFGATGFIGTNLSKRLRSAGVETTLCDVVPPFEMSGSFVKTDVTVREQVEDALRDTAQVIFLVSHPLPESLVDPKKNFDVNMGGLLNVLEVLRNRGGGRMLFASASSVYGTPPSGPVPESTACKPKTPYAVSKYASEHYLRVFHELYNVDFVAFRLFNVYGPGQAPSSGALIPRVLELIATGRKVEVFGDGTQSRDFIFVDDVASYFERALRSAVTGEVVNLGTGNLTSVAEIVRIGGEVVGRTPIIETLPARPGEISNFCADTTKLRSLFGKENLTDIREGLKRTYQWMINSGVITGSHKS